MNLETSDPLQSSGSPKREPLPEWVRLIFRDWEKIRILYNVILFVVTIGISTLIFYSGYSENHSNKNILLVVSLAGAAFFGSIIANICYFAGPITESYYQWMGFDFPFPRIFLFIVGTLVASLLAFFTLFEVSVALKFL